jgi:hypothetical protein
MQTAQQRRESTRRYYEQNKEKFALARDRYRVRNMAFVTEAKAKPCRDCGVQYPPVAMDFDHVRGQKVADLSTLVVGSSLDRIREEIAKCEVVCANCHRIRTASRLYSSVRPEQPALTRRVLGSNPSGGTASLDDAIPM